MSAGKGAQPIAPNDTKSPRVKCVCGWTGHAGQLIAEEVEDTIYCPQCETSGWEFVCTLS